MHRIRSLFVVAVMTTISFLTGCIDDHIPKNVTVVPGDTTVTVSWDVEGSGNIFYYSIYSSDIPGGALAHPGTSATESPHVIYGLTNGTRYYFQLTAWPRWHDGETSPSAEVSAVPGVPLPPANPKATPGDGQVQVSWDAAALATSYDLYWSTTSGAGKSGTKITGATSPQDVVGLTGGTRYYFVVTGQSQWGESDPSAEVSATPWSTSQTAAPSFSVPGGWYATPQVVGITCATTGAEIHYTTDGSEPTITSPTYSIPISLSSSTVLKAIAKADGLTVSSVTSASYTIGGPQPHVATPQFTPVPGTYLWPQQVTISCALPPGATIHYTTDGTIPNDSSPVYAGPISISTGTTLNAYAMARGYLDSALQTGSYTITNPGTAAPSVSPTSGLYSNPVLVTLTCATPGAVIYYTVDGTDPTVDSPRYVEPFTVAATPTTVKAMAKAPYMAQSPISQVTYTLKAAAPEFSPPGGTYTGAQTVAMTSSTTGATIRYTVDGTTPTPSTGTVYTAPISVAATTTIKAIAARTGMTTSDVTTAAYTIATGAAPYIYAQVISPSTGTESPIPWSEMIQVCSDVACNIPIVDATVTVNGEPVIWNSSQSSYVATNLVALGATVNLSVAVGSTTYTASATQFSSGPTNTTNGHWLSGSGNFITWSAVEGTTGATYFAGILNGSGQYVFPAGGLPQEVAIGTTSLSVPGGSLTAGSYSVVTGIAMAGVTTRTGGVVIANGASGSKLWLGVISAPLVRLAVY
jgi:hypothetical protein